MQKMIFARVGGLSPVDYSPAIRRGDRFHRPPARKGIYAFIWPYIETFLFSWKLCDVIDRQNKKPLPEKDYDVEYKKLYRAIGFRKFSYSGPIWTHLGRVTSGYWNLTDTDELPRLIRKDNHCLIKSLTKSAHTNGWNHHVNKVTTDPLKAGRGLGITFARDHMEVFIEKRYLNRIG